MLDPGLFVPKAPSCDTCAPVKKDVFDLAECEGTRAGLKPCTCGPCGKLCLLSSHFHQQQREDPGEKGLRREGNGALFVKSRIPASDSIFPCEEAEKDFQCVTGLLQEQAIPSGEHPHGGRGSGAFSHPQQGQRSERGEACYRKVKFTEQQSTHARESLHKCSQCDKSYVHKKRLLEHQRIHTGGTPHECSKCGMSLKYKSSLNQHWKVHTGKRPYKCSDCGKSFIFQKRLVEHQRMHTGGRL